MEADPNNQANDPADWLSKNGPQTEADLESARQEAGQPDPISAPAEKAAPKEEASAASGDDLSKARDAITRKFSGTAEAMLKGLSDEQVLVLGTQLAADLKRYNDQANELDRAKKGQETSGHEDNGKDSEQGAREGARPSEGDGAASAAPSDLEGILGTLDVDLFGEELPAALKAISEHTAKQMEHKFQERFQDFMDGEVRRHLVERFPRLQEPEHAKAVAAAMKTLEPGMSYADPNDLRGNRTKLMEHALVVVDPNAFLESKETQSKGKGGPVPPKRNSAKPASKSLSHEGQALAFLREMEKTGDMATAKRHFKN